jgi:inner membrane transporter RhtA
MNGFFYEALSRIPLGVAVSIEFLGPLALAAVLSRRPRDLIWVGLALAGIALFFLDTSARDEPLDPVGVLAVLAAAAFWAGYILCSHRVGQVARGHGGLTVGMTVAALIVLPFGVPVVPVLAQDALLLAAAAGAAVFASVIPYTLELAALRRLPRPVFGILLSLEPVLATLAGALILGQGVSLLGWVAVVVIVTASVGSTATSREVHAEPTVS